MRAIRQFLGTDDEQGFILVHAAMVAKTNVLVSAQMVRCSGFHSILHAGMELVCTSFKVSMMRVMTL
jgi:hypothetical protein